MVSAEPFLHGTGTLQCLQKEMATYTDLCPFGKTQTMSHIVESCPLTKLNIFILATLCRWRRCVMADQLWFMTRIREEEEEVQCDMMSLLFVPRTRTTKLSRQSFTVAAPVIWNSLPAHLRSPLISRGQFQAGLKTHLFKQAYSLWEHFVKRLTLR